MTPQRQQRLDQILDIFREELTRPPQNRLQNANGGVTSREISDRLGLPYATAANELQSLQKQGIIRVHQEPVGPHYDRTLLKAWRLNP